ncbi:MAG: DUF177 domain-containing protein [Deltaproteobacteria bacterium]|nr:DUF177 domain-containing protein [Deltaproteobacteria bacterium]
MRGYIVAALYGQEVLGLRLDINQIASNGTALHLDMAQPLLSELLDLGTDELTAVKARGPLHVDVELLCTGDDYSVVGRIECKVEQTCIRCLDPVSTSLNLPIRVVFSRESTGFGANRDDLEPGKDHYLFSGHYIDLDEMIRENILLGLPDYPLCKEDCLGLCPVCGKNLNFGPCSCSKDEPDPRLAELSNVKL